MLAIQRCPDAGAPRRRQAGRGPEPQGRVSPGNRRGEVSGDTAPASRPKGDAAVAGFTQKFDGVALAPGGFRVPRKALDDARATMDRELEEAVTEAAANIRSFHRRQLRGSWFLEDGDGVVLGKRVLPLRRGRPSAFPEGRPRCCRRC